MNTVTAKCLGTSPLNENEKGQISAYKLETKSISFIARELLRSQTVVRNFLKDPELYGTRKCPGCPPKITNAARHWLFQEGQSSSRDLQKSQNLPITLRRVRQLLHESPNLVYQNKKTPPNLTAKHKMCIDWVKKSDMDKREMWKTMVFSDEKKFNLDGLDSSHCYWHNLRKEKQLFFKKTIWRRICYGLDSFFCIWKGSFSSDGRETKLCLIYQCVGKKDFFTFMNRLDTNNTIFQQDNPALLTSKLTKDGFKTKNISFGMAH